MVKQIRNGEVVEKVLDDFKGYFHWLQKMSGLNGTLSSMLAETEFISVDGIDDVLLEKAKEETRRRYAENIAEEDNLNAKDTETLYKSIRGSVCLFEVIVCLAYSVNEMFEDLDAYDGCQHFFGIMMKNAGFDLYDDEDLDIIGDQVKEYWRRCINRIIERSYEPDGKLGLFPVKEPSTDRRCTSLWQQMNDWVDQHTNEDGEWVD